MQHLVFKRNPLVSILFTFATNLSNTVFFSFFTTSLFTTLLNLLNSTETVLNMWKPVPANLDVSTPVAFFKYFCVA